MNTLNPKLKPSFHRVQIKSLNVDFKSDYQLDTVQGFSRGGGGGVGFRVSPVT